jgi:acetylornithine deacetylase
MHLFELTRKLIEIESITGNEKQIAFFLRDYLAGLGYRVTLQEVASERFNVQAFLDDPFVVFTTHLDTVPPHIPFREDGEFIYGRGACDAKGIIAAQIEAAERLRADGENRFGLLFVVGEERNSAGALLANRNPPGSMYFIDGEPTENRLALASKGSLRVEMVARGRSAHSAYPEQGDSAILKLLDTLQDLRSLELPSDPELGKSTCNIGVLEGGTKPNVIPDFARAEVMFRSVVPPGRLKERVEALVRGRCEIHYRFEVPVGCDGGLRDDRSLLRERCPVSRPLGQALPGRSRIDPGRPHRPRASFKEGTSGRHRTLCQPRAPLAGRRSAFMMERAI